MTFFPKLKIDKTLLGVICYLSGMFISVAISIFVKKIMVQYKLPAWEVVFIRHSIIVALLIPFMVKFKFNFFNKYALKLNTIRNLFYFASTITFYIVMTKLPVNDCISIEFLVPVFAGIFAMILLREKGSKIMWLALAICILGAGVVKRPTMSNKAEFYAYLMLFAVVLMRAMTITLNGKLATEFKTSTIVFYTNIMMLIMSSFFCMTFIKPHPMAILILFFSAIFYCIEYILIFTAHKWCTVLTLQPCEFSKMLYSIVLSSLVLGEATTKNQIYGSIIILIGFYIMVIGKKNIEIKKTKVNGLKK